MAEDYVFLVEAFNDLEGDIIFGLLESAGIPARKKDRNSYTGAMRIIGGQAYEIKILVPAHRLEEAQALLREVAEENKE